MGDVPGSVIAHWQAGVRDDDGVEVSVTIDTPITHASRGFAGHIDLSVPLLHAGKNTIVLTGTAKLRVRSARRLIRRHKQGANRVSRG